MHHPSTRAGIRLASSLALLSAAVACRPQATTPSVIIAASPETVSIRNSNVSIDFLITEVGKHFGLRLDLPTDLHGRTSIHLRDVTWRQIFTVALRPVGYDFYEDRAGRIVIRRQEVIDQLPPITEIVVLRHQKPAAAQAYLARAFPEVPTRLIEDRLSFSAHPKTLSRLRDEIHRIDQPDISLERYTRPLYLPADLPEHLLPKRTLGPDNADLTTWVLTVEKIDAGHLLPYLRRETEKIPGAKVQTDVRVNALIVTAPESLEPRTRAVVSYLDDDKWYSPSDTSPPQ